MIGFYNAMNLNFGEIASSTYKKALNIPNLLYMRKDFNIRDAKQNLFIFEYYVTGQVLKDLVDSYSLV